MPRSAGSVSADLRSRDWVLLPCAKERLRPQSYSRCSPSQHLTVHGQIQNAHLGPNSLCLDPGEWMLMLNLHGAYFHAQVLHYQRHYLWFQVGHGPSTLSLQSSLSASPMPRWCSQKWCRWWGTSLPLPLRLAVESLATVKCGPLPQDSKPLYIIGIHSQCAFC